MPDKSITKSDLNQALKTTEDKLMAKLPSGDELPARKFESLQFEAPHNKSKDEKFYLIVLAVEKVFAKLNTLLNKTETASEQAFIRHGKQLGNPESRLGCLKNEATRET